MKTIKIDNKEYNWSFDKKNHIPGFFGKISIYGVKYINNEKKKISKKIYDISHLYIPTEKSVEELIKYGRVLNFKDRKNVEINEKIKKMLK